MRNIIFAILLLAGPSSGASELIVHEWGTFTSFMGSDGQVQEGLHHEEEPLPSFVYGVGNNQNPRLPFPEPDPNEPCPVLTKIPCDSLYSLSENRTPSERLPVNAVNSGITQKMETPVIYFYGDVGTNINVQIDFPKGIISQYFPRASHFFPKLNNVTTLGPSHFEFDVTLHEVNDNSRIPVTPAHSIWNPARQVNANTISTGQGVQTEFEKFIFYRGVGDFHTNFKVTNERNDILLLQNDSGQPIQDALILNFDGVKGIVKTIKGFGRVTKAKVPNLDGAEPYSEYVKKAKGHLVRALVKSGLYKDEALGLANTWEKSYFRSPGVRVLYIVPRAETERILPLKFSPKPDALVRTLVGRVEVMTLDQEESYMDLLAHVDGELDLLQVFGRFHEPKLRRLLSLVPKSTFNPKVKEQLKTRIEQLLN